jgi:hypothetical protein
MILSLLFLQQFPARDLLLERNIHVPFKVDGSLVVGVPFSVPKGIPYWISHRLILRKSGKAEIIESINELAGKVKLRTPGDALSFVRLRTSPETFYLFRGGDLAWLEVLPREKFNLGHVFGDRNLYGELRRVKDAARGVVHRSQMPLEYLPPSVSLSKFGFVVKRVVVKENLVMGDHELCMLTETVTPDGTITADARKLRESNVAGCLAYMFRSALR